MKFQKVRQIKTTHKQYIIRYIDLAIKSFQWGLLRGSRKLLEGKILKKVKILEPNWTGLAFLQRCINVRDLQAVRTRVQEQKAEGVGR